MKGTSLLSDVAERHTEIDELPLCAGMYISSNHGSVGGKLITISTPWVRVYNHTEPDLLAYTGAV